MPFQLCSLSVLVTYPQVPSSWTCESVRDGLMSLERVPVGYCIGQENHADGGLHFHAFLQFDPRLRTKNPRFFDLDGFHANILPCKFPREAYEYAKKEGRVLEHNIKFKPPKKSWGEILEECGDAESFTRAVQTHYPRDAVLHLDKLEYFCERRFKPKLPPYVPRHVEFILPQSLTDWVETHLRGGNDRPKSLYLVGPSRFGKTEWARSLGDHTYWNGMVNLDDWNFDGKYLVLDDIEWKFLPAKKSLLGAQRQITLTDKYRKKVTLEWGKPCIYLCNEDMDVFNTCAEKKWLWDNCCYVILHNKLY